MSDPLAAGFNPQVPSSIDGLVVRPIRDGDTEAIGEALRQLGTPEHTERGLERQNEGLGAFFIAWLKGEAVGYITAHWRASPRSPQNWLDGETAYFEDFIVVERLRGRGIGTAVMAAAESMALDRGLRRMTIGVGVENEGARRLYRRLGYADAGLEPIEDRGRFRRWDGTLHEWSETWRFMVKEIQRVRARRFLRPAVSGRTQCGASTSLSGQGVRCFDRRITLETPPCDRSGSCMPVLT